MTTLQPTEELTMQEVVQPVQEVGLTAGGWVTMIFSLTLVWTGTFWCFKTVLSADPEKEHVPSGYGA